MAEYFQNVQDTSYTTKMLFVASMYFRRSFGGHIDFDTLSADSTVSFQVTDANGTTSDPVSFTVKSDSKCIRLYPGLMYLTYIKIKIKPFRVGQPSIPM